MRILYHHRTMGDGAEGIHITEMVNAFKELGHEVFVAGPAAHSKKKKSDKKSKFFQYIKQLIKGPAYDVLELAYNVYGYFYLKNIINRFKPDIIYDRYITFNYSCIAAGKKYRIPVFLEVNAPLAFERAHEPDEKLYFKELAYKLERKICTHSDKTIVVSSPLKQYLVNIGVPEGKLLLMPNGVNLQKFRPKTKSREYLLKIGGKPDSIVVGFVGILRPWHGIDLLLEAFNKLHAQLDDTHLLLVGDGHIRQYIEEQAKLLNISRSLYITGRVPHGEVANYIALFDIAVSPKATFYASPMKIVEYMAQAKAVVAPNMQNIADLITDGKNGILFKPESSESLFNALFGLAIDVNIRSRIGAAAYHTTRNKLNWANNAQRIINEYYSIIKNQR